MKNKDYLKKALTNLGFTFTEASVENGLMTQGNYGVKEKVDILITGNGSQNYNGAVGFQKKEDGTYTAIGDFYGLRTKNGKSVSSDYLKCEVTAHSKEIEVNERLAQLSFSLEEGSRTENDKEITFTLSRWVAD